MRYSIMETLITAESDGPTLTAAAAASCLPTGAVYKLPANWFDIGRQLKLWAQGKVSTVITTPGTLRFDVRLGGTIVFDGLAILPDTVAPHSNVLWELEIMLTCRAIGNGTNANLMGSGKFFSEDKGSLFVALPWNTAPVVGAGFNSVQDNTVDLFFTQTVATGSLTLQQYSLIAMN